MISACNGALNPSAVADWGFSDENAPTTPWESNTSGATPQVTWTPLPSGGAIAALLDLLGTGLLGEYEIAKPQVDQGDAKAPADGQTAYQVIWREVRAPLEAFGQVRNEANSPVPTVLPALNLTLNASQTQFVTLHNGYTVRTSDGRRLGGAEAFQVRWSGVLLVDCEGEYEFHAGAPTPEGEKPDFERAEKCSWRVTLKRGQKTWVVLSHQWMGKRDTSAARPV